MLFYVPPLLPVMSQRTATRCESVEPTTCSTPSRGARADRSTWATCFGAGNDRQGLATRCASRWRCALWRRATSRSATSPSRRRRRRSARPTARRRRRTTSTSSRPGDLEERFVIPPMQREEAIEMMRTRSTTSSFGRVRLPRRTEEELNLMRPAPEVHDALACCSPTR